MTQLVKKNCSDNCKNIIMYTIFNGHLVSIPHHMLEDKKRWYQYMYFKVLSQSSYMWLINTSPPPPLPYSFQILLHLPKRLVIRMLVWTMVQILNIEHQKELPDMCIITHYHLILHLSIIWYWYSFFSLHVFWIALHFL